MKYNPPRTSRLYVANVLKYFRYLSHFQVAFVPKGQKPLPGPFLRDKQVSALGRKNLAAKSQITSYIKRVSPLV